MKQFLLLMLFLLVAGTHQSDAQTSCTPVDCLDSLLAAGGLPLGGLCGNELETGQSGTAYFTVKTVSFAGACFNAREIQPDFPLAVPVRLTQVSNIRFSNFPAGITITTNAPSYTVPNNGRNSGCATFTGTPTEAGVFAVRLDVSARVQPCVPLIPALNQEADFALELTILPDASFTGVPALVTVTDGPFTLIATGTQGGSFSGPGVIGNTFDPSTLVPGIYTITYTVSAKEGAAIDSATNSSTFTIMVEQGEELPEFIFFADKDGDGLGDPNDSIIVNIPEAPEGFVANNDDCDDNNPEIGAAATWFADADGDGFGDPDNSVETCEQPEGYVANNFDCDDNNAKIKPGTVWYADRDDDGFTNHETVTQCNRPEGFKLFTELRGTQLDPNDNDASIKPNVPAGPGSCEGINNVAVSNISTSGFNVSVAPIVGALIYKFEIRIPGSTWIEAALSSSNSANISGLEACTDYEVRAITLCECGIAEPSIPEEVKTDGCQIELPCDIPSELIAERRTFNTVTVRWNSTPAAISYNVRIRPVGTQAWNTVNVMTTDRVFGSLNIFRVYEIQVQAICDTEVSEWSASITYDPRSGGVSTLPQLRMDPNFDEMTGSFRVVEDSSSISAYPNPVQGTLFLTYVGRELDNVVLSILDASGKQHRAERWGRLVTSTIDVNVSNLAPGMYFLQIQSADEILPTQTIIVK
jgi:hypothetical protein